MVNSKPHFKQLFKTRGDYSSGFGTETPIARWENRKSMILAGPLSGTNDGGGEAGGISNTGRAKAQWLEASGPSATASSSPSWLKSELEAVKQRRREVHEGSASEQ